MRASQLLIDTVRSLYLSGMDHRQIEREIHALGCLTFTRRSLYNQKTKTGYRKGWIEKYGWKKELDQFQLQDRAATSTPRAETRVLTSVFYHPLENGALRNERPSEILHSQLSTVNCPLGRQPGEALCPDRFTREDLLRIKRKLGSYSFSALYQQRPTPPEGGLFKRSWFTRIVNRPPENLRWARGYDLAVSTKDSADFTASFRCALDKTTGDLYIADGFRKRIEFPEQKRFIIERIRQERNTEHGIEQALHAQAFVQELRRQPGLITRPIRLVRPAADKFTRALSWANLAEEGKVVLVRGMNGGTNPAFRQPNWIDAFLEEICTFPNSTHDDQLDAVSTAVEMLERRKHVAYGF